MCEEKGEQGGKESRRHSSLHLGLGDPVAGSASLRSPPVSSYLAVLKPAGADKSFVRELPPLDWLWWMDFTPLGVLIPGCVNKVRPASTWRGASPSAAWMTSARVLDAVQQHSTNHHFQQRQLESAHQSLGGVLDAIQNFLVILDAEQTSRFALQSRDISWLTKVLVRLTMTLHTWSRILMEYISSSRRLKP